MASGGGGFLGQANSFLGSPVGGLAGGLVSGLLGGILGGKSGPSHAQQNFMNLNNQNINKLEGYANGIPLSDPQEQAALAQQRGFVGAEQMNARGNLFSQYNPTVDAGNRGDLLSNLHNQEVGQRSSLDASALFNSLQQRRQALSQVTPMIQTGFGMASQQPPPNPNGDLPALFGNLMQTIAYNKSRNQKNAATDNPLGGSGGSASTQGGGGLHMPGAMAGVGTGGPASGGALGTGHYGLGPAIQAMGGPNGTAGSLNPHDQGMWNLGQSMLGGR